MLFIANNNYTNIILKQKEPILIGIGYPLNYLDSQDKLYKYLQMHRFTKKIISQRIQYFTYTKKPKMPLCYDTNMLPYFKQLNDTLFKKNRLKLGNYDYRTELTEEIIDGFCQEFYNEIHSHIIQNFEDLILQLKQRGDIIKNIYVNKKPEDHIAKIFQEYLNIDLLYQEFKYTRLIYNPGFLYFQ